jgi:hypothetical protein
MANNLVKSHLQFLAYTKAKYPVLYRAAMNHGERNGGLRGLGETVEEIIARQDAFGEPAVLTPGAIQSNGTSATSGSVVDVLTSAMSSITDLMAKVLPTTVAIKQAKTCIDINAQRAKAGQPPIDCANAGLTPEVKVGVSDNVKPMLYVALAIGAAFLFLGFKKRK